MPALRHIIYAGILLTSVIGYAQSDSTKQLGPVSVFHPRDTILKLAELKSTAPVYFIRADKLSELGAVDAGDALKVVPGVQLRDYGGIGGLKTVSFRSLSANHTSVILDGNLIHDNQTGAINLSTFDLLGVESISFATAMPRDPMVPASAYLAANTVQVSSTMPVNYFRPEAHLYSSVTTVNAYENGLLFKVPVKKFQISGSGILRHGNGQYNYTYPASGSIETHKRVHSFQTDYRLKAFAGYELDRGLISAQVHYRSNNQELPGAVVLYNPYNDQELSNTDFKSTLNYRQIFDKWTTSGHLFFQRNNTRYQDPTFLNAQGYIDSQYEQDYYGGGFMLMRRLNYEREGIFFGTDLHVNTLNSNELVTLPYRFQNNSVLGIRKWLSKGILLAESHVAAQLINDYYESNSVLEKRSFAQLSPYASLALLPFESESFRLRTFYKRTFRLPTFNDLFYNFIGNTDLQPEVAHLSNLGMTYGKELGKIRFELTADGYYNYVRNKIVAIPTKDIFNWSMQNIGKSRAVGVDLSALMAFKLKEVLFTLGTNHNFNETVDITDPESATYGHQLPYTPYYSSSHSAAINWKGFGVNSNLVINGWRYSLNENIYSNLMDEFYDLNVGVSYKLDLKKRRFILLHAKVMNLLGNNYEVIKSYPMPGRYYQFTLRARI